MISKQVISISDLRTNATNIIKDLPKKGNQYIFIHNKPKAVLVDIEWFEKIQGELPTKDDIDAFKESSHGEYGIDAFEFLDLLKNKKCIK